MEGRKEGRKKKGREYEGGKELTHFFVSLFVILITIVSLLFFFFLQTSRFCFFNFFFFMQIDDVRIVELRGQRFEELHFRPHLHFSAVGQSLLGVTNSLV